MAKGKDPQISLLTAFLTYLSYCMLIIVGHLRDFFANITGITRYEGVRTKKGYSQLLKSWESFFTRRLYHRVQDCWNRPISSNPGSYFDVMERSSANENCTLQTTGKTIRCLNLGSYNYLGFGDNWAESCSEEVMDTLSKEPVASTSSRMDFGTNATIVNLEKAVAAFMGKEDAIVLSMGYGANFTTIPALVGKNALIISDSLNHTSLVNGSRSSSAQIRVFNHNEPAHLEQVLRESIIQGQPRHHRPWAKIVVMVEGIYSMEGAICNLPEIVRICKKYKAYVYVDEAHSVGALGKTGRGICEYHGVDTNDVDVLMGTFSKSFGGMGGYIASSKEVIAALRATSCGALYHNSMSPIVTRQVMSALRIISSPSKTGLGQQKITQLAENANWFRKEMERIGLHTYGDYDSPIIPVLIYQPGKISAFSRECLSRGVAVVVVGFPATSIVLSRARFCISASHTRSDLEYAVKVIEEVAELLCLRYENNMFACNSL